MIMRLINKLKLQTTLLLFMAGVCLIPLLFLYVQNMRFINDEYYASSAEQVFHVARYVAADEKVIAETLRPGSNDFDAFCAYLDALTTVSRVRYIVPMNMQGIRLFHPDREKIGLHFVGGDEARALQGESYVSSAYGTLGLSQRAFVPMYGPERKQIGAVAVGILTGEIESLQNKTNRSLAFMALFTVVLALGLSMFFSQSIKNILLGYEPVEIAQQLEQRNAMLHMVNEGVVAIDLDGKITLVNEEARRILKKAEIEGPLLHTFIEDSIPGSRLYQVLKQGSAEYDYEQCIPPITLLTNNMPLTINGVTSGAISTFKDMSDVRALAERIVDISRYVDALRSQSHEFMNKLHAMLGLLNSGKTDELRAYIMQIADLRSANNSAVYASMKDPVIAGFILSKYSEAFARGLGKFSLEGTLPAIEDTKLQHALVTILGNLIDNALDAVQNSPKKEFHLTFSVASGVLELFFVDSGHGMDEETLMHIFEKSYSTKGEGRGLGLWLVIKAVDSLGGTIEASSQPGVGTAFQICLPLEEEQRGG